MYTIGTLRGIAATIIDLFEDLLDKNNVTISDSCRQGDPDEARIYGDTYYALEDSITRILERLVSKESGLSITNYEKYSEAVDEVCICCMYNDEKFCKKCPVRKSFDRATLLRKESKE